MRDMAGGPYAKSLATTFQPEPLSMRFRMAGMVATMAALRSRLSAGEDPARLVFWFVMSMTLIPGFGFACSVNGRLATRGSKHGTFTLRRERGRCAGVHDEMARRTSRPSASTVAGMAVLSSLFPALGVAASRRRGCFPLERGWRGPVGGKSTGRGVVERVTPPAAPGPPASATERLRAGAEANAGFGCLSASTSR